MTDRPLAIIDIDGVVADVVHRLHFLDRRPKQWSAFFKAAPNDGIHKEGIAVIDRLKQDHDIIFLTGRPEQYRKDTEKWLRENNLDYQVTMRPDGMRIPSAEYKRNVLQRLSKKHTIGLIVDDDIKVINAAKKAGFATFFADWEKRTIAQQGTLSYAQNKSGKT